MNRRIFIQNSLITAATAAIFIPQLGCSKASLAAYVTTIGTAITNVVKILAPTLAPKLTAAWQLAVTDINSWQAGSPAADAEQALTDFLAVVTSLPISSIFQDVIDAAVTGIIGILDLFPQTNTMAHAFNKAAINTAKSQGANVTPIKLSSLDENAIKQARTTFKTTMRTALRNHPELKGVSI